MSKDIAVISQEELNALALEMGASAEDLQGGGGTFLPQFKVWTDDDEDDDNAPRLKGKLYITGQEPLVYAKPNTVRFRALTHTFQWTDYDNDAKKTVNRTRLISSFKEEARDEKGTLRCGKPPSKELRDNEALKKKFESVTTYRRLQGYVSYVGTTADGKEVEVKDVLVSINAKGASFTAFDEQVIRNMPPKTMLWDFESSITLNKEKNGSVTYWVMQYEPDFANKLPMTVDVFNTVKELKANIDAFNKEVDTKYYDAISNRDRSESAIDALKTVSGMARPAKGGTLDDDFEDDIPF